jgi:HSP20 family protein
MPNCSIALDRASMLVRKSSVARMRARKNDLPLHERHSDEGSSIAALAVMGNVDKKQGAPQDNPNAQGMQKSDKPVQPTAQQTPPPQRGEVVRRDPYEMMMRDPFNVFAQSPLQLMREMMMDPFRMFRQFAQPQAMWNPEFEIRETDDAYVFRADMPGVTAQDLEITLVGDQLRIIGKREQEQHEGEGRFHTYERSYGSFSRAFSLPDTADVDNIRSDLKDGVLTLVVPKKSGAQPQKRKIQIGSGSKS